MRKVLYLMGSLNDDDVEWLAQVGEVQQVKKGQVLIAAHRATQWLYVVLEGHLDVLFGDGQVIARLGQGELLGEISFLDSRPPSAAVTATERTSVLALQREMVQAQLEQDRGFAARFYRGLGMLLADRLRATSWQFGYLQSKARGAPKPVDNPADELDDAWTEHISFASMRFQHLLEQVGVSQ